MSKWSFLFFFLSIHVTWDSTWAQNPLDLPRYYFHGDEEEDENEPETILFYGEAFEGSCFVWILDKSGSMAGQRMEILKFEVTQAIQTLSNNAYFGIVAFSSDVIRFSSVIAQAAASRKQAAYGWVNALNPYGMTQMADGLYEGIELSRRCPNRIGRQMILVSDGSPTDGMWNVWAVINTFNHPVVPINTILIATGGTAAAETIQFMQEIANQTGGSFKLIN